MHESLPQFFFYVFAALAVFSAVMVVTQNNPVRSVLFLVLTFFASAMLWMLLEAEFLSLILVLVYVGAVMTLFLFVVMMLDLDTGLGKTAYYRYVITGTLLLALLTGLLLFVLPKNSFRTETASLPVTQAVHTAGENADTLPALPALSNTEQIGMVLYTQYVFAFELAAVILLVAIIAAITLAHRPARGTRQQDILRQIMTKRSDRVTLVSVPAEIKNKERE